MDPENSPMVSTMFLTNKQWFWGSMLICWRVGIYPSSKHKFVVLPRYFLFA